ncbi:MAG: hypothetical protein LBN33_09835 [Desulfovibrio sp.]|jgi:hypothetical protein|nr:hypothetical protein [Desulfovibrio sp.]
MRRYLQGTLDFACAVYAVINALSCLYAIPLNSVREIFQKSMEDFARYPRLWSQFLGNKTDHYWVIRYMLRRWCAAGPFKLDLRLPFAALAPTDQDLNLGPVSMYLPENLPPQGEAHTGESAFTPCQEGAAVLDALQEFFAGTHLPAGAAILRFHRFLPGVTQPVISHWTTVRTMENQNLCLWDASPEQDSLHVLPHSSLLPNQGKAMLRIVPESIYFVSLPCPAPSKKTNFTFF